MVIQKDTGTAHNRLSDWYWQRLSALVLLVTVPLPFLLLWGGLFRGVESVHPPMLRVSLIGAMLVVMAAAGIWWLALVWAWE